MFTLTPIRTVTFWGSKLVASLSSTSAASAGVNEVVKQSFPKKGIALLALSNVKKRNALSFEVLTKLKDHIKDLSNNKGVKVIVISSEGSVFSSGHDLKELLAETGKEYHQEIFHRCTEVMQLIQDVPLPVIAQVSGLATAAGCQLVASCDIAVASDTAQFATPGVKVGLFCSTPGVALSRSVPKKIALQMLFTGEPISAETALQHGLVSCVVTEDQLEHKTLSIASQVCQYSSDIIALGKSFFYQQYGMGRDQAYQLAESTMVHNLSLADGQEGIQAFVAKRHPSWLNKL